MICRHCGTDTVVWTGPLVALTGTRCLRCGSTNCQIDVADPDCDTCNGLGEIDERAGGIATSGVVPCPDCMGDR